MPRGLGRSRVQIRNRPELQGDPGVARTGICKGIGQTNRVNIAKRKAHTEDWKAELPNLEGQNLP